jgi:holo-[acyl-carrier protein] synthase
MILGIGTDLVEIERIRALLAAHGMRFIARCFAAEEQNVSLHDPVAPAHYAKRFAAKEAASKALGSGIARGVYLKDMVVTKLDNGAPVLSLRGGAADFLKQQAINTKLHISLSDDGGYASAFVIIEAV